VSVLMSERKPAPPDASTAPPVAFTLESVWMSERKPAPPVASTAPPVAFT
jgi:hypothetical protein